MLRHKALFPGLMAVLVAGFALGEEAIPNWPAPATWSPHSASRGASTMSAITSPLPFIGVTPCRVADTRGNGFTGQYGPPALVANATRSFTIVGQCSIPASAAAVSFNFAALNVGAAGDLRVFPAGGGAPLVSTLNYNANTPNIANAGVVPLGTGGAITVLADAVAIDLIIDVNGYYAPAGVGTSNTFLGLNAGNFTMTGDFNTGFGRNALSSNTTGDFNTATGSFALGGNTAGFANTATGYGALGLNTTGCCNTGTGYGALSRTTGDSNTAMGTGALQFNTTGFRNTASGHNALVSNTTGGFNTATGAGALQNTTGSANIAIGYEAGINLTTGSNNICIGNSGVAGESGTIRIGTAQTATFIAGISGATSSSGIGVFVNSSGQLGTTTSSRRFKEDIREIAEESGDLMRLRPVAFRYKPQIDPTGLTQYGLIAEEVAEVMPEMVQFSPAGEAETVRYHFLAPLLLNELQKQHETIEEQRKQIAMLQKEKDRQITLLEARLAVLEEQSRERKPSGQGTK